MPDEEPGMFSVVRDAFLSASSVALLCPLPEAFIFYLLRLIGWDWRHLITFITLCVYFNVICNDDRATLDEDVKRLVVRLTTNIGYYHLTKVLIYHMYEKVTFSDVEQAWYYTELSNLFQCYLYSVNGMAFFRIVMHSVVLFIFIIAKTVTYFAI